jgi:hypothetical protein
MTTHHVKLVDITSSSISNGVTRNDRYRSQLLNTLIIHFRSYNGWILPLIEIVISYVYAVVDPCLIGKDGLSHILKRLPLQRCLHETTTTSTPPIDNGHANDHGDDGDVDDTNTKKDKQVVVGPGLSRLSAHTALTRHGNEWMSIGGPSYRNWDKGFTNIGIWYRQSLMIIIFQSDVIVTTLIPDLSHSISDDGKTKYQQAPIRLPSKFMKPGPACILMDDNFIFVMMDKEVMLLNLDQWTFNKSHHSTITAHDEPSLVIVDDDLYILNGTTNDAIGYCERYNPITGTFRSIAPMTNACQGAHGLYLPYSLYYCDGWSGSLSAIGNMCEYHVI